jgi:hypothetical protein
MVLTVPAMKKNRYFVFQMMDLYTGTVGPARMIVGELDTQTRN